MNRIFAKNHFMFRVHTGLITETLKFGVVVITVCGEHTATANVDFHGGTLDIGPWVYEMKVGCNKRFVPKSEVWSNPLLQAVKDFESGESVGGMMMNSIKKVMLDKKRKSNANNIAFQSGVSIDTFRKVLEKAGVYHDDNDIVGYSDCGCLTVSKGSSIGYCVLYEDIDGLVESCWSIDEERFLDRDEIEEQFMFGDENERY